MVQAIVDMDIEVIHFHGESNHGHFEIVTKYTDALQACDESLIVKYAIGKVYCRNI